MSDWQRCAWLCSSSLASRSAGRATLESRRSFDGVTEGGPIQFISTNDLYIKDAFLVFRALCKLSMKPLGAER